MIDKKGKIILLSGPSGSGKGTLVEELISRCDGRIGLSVSATTRQPRPGEIDGVHYYFLTQDVFLKKIENNDMLEYAEYCGNFYGTPRQPVQEMLDKGISVILEIEVQGALQVKEKRPDARMIYTVPPSAAILKRRLERRQTETRDVIRKRLRIAAEELRKAPLYDYILINDDIVKTCDEFERAIETDINNTDDMKEFLEGVILDVEALSQ